MIKKEIKSLLKTKKNLLAFSAGIDSSALFFILLENGIEFDVAIVDYGIRKSSKDEIAYAQAICKKFNKKLFIKNVTLNQNNFEAMARKARYDFFKDIIQKHSYQNLLTAHQLNDKVEWFFMQFSKGAGLKEILGMQEITKEDDYFLVRPLLYTSRDEILDYLKKNNIKYFIDSTNQDIKYKRNFFSKNLSFLFPEFKNAITKSFEYLENDLLELTKDIFEFQEKKLIFFEKTNTLQDIRKIDYFLKKLGYLMSKAQRDEIARTKDCVVGRKFAVVYSNNLIYIAPYIKQKIRKKDRELMRIAKIPPKIRGYIYQGKIRISQCKPLQQ